MLINGTDYTITPEADLSGADLSRAYLSGEDLSRAYLCRAVFTGANLTGANLFRACLCRANLTGANLTGANLTSANLTGVDLTAVNLTRANLTGANLTGAYLTGAKLSGVIGLLPNSIIPLQIFGSQHVLIVRSVAYITIGCKHHTVEWWEKHCLEVGVNEGYSDLQILEYTKHIAYAKKWMEVNGVLDVLP